jgi:hypothetical protein
VRDALQQAGRAMNGGRNPARQALVAVQLALATPLVVCAALLMQSLIRLQRGAAGLQRSRRRDQDLQVDLLVSVHLDHNTSP